MLFLLMLDHDGRTARRKEKETDGTEKKQETDDGEKMGRKETEGMIKKEAKMVLNK